MKNIKIEEFVSYNGHAVKSNATVNLNLKAKYSEIVKTINLLQLLNNDVTVTVNKDTKLGVFRVANVVVDGDGESKIKLESMNDFVEMDAVNSLVSIDGEFKILFEANVDFEDAEEETQEEADEENDDSEWDDEEWDEEDE